MTELSRLLRLMMPDWRTSALLLTCIALATALGLAPPLLIRLIIDVALPERNAALLNLLAATIVGAAVLAGLVGVGTNYLATVLGQNVIFSLRCRLYEALQGQSLDFFRHTRVGDVLTRLQSDVEGLQNVVSGTLVTSLAHIIGVTCTLGVIFAMEWRLAVVATLVLPLFIIPARRIGIATTRLSRESQEALAKLSSIAQEALSVGGFLLVRLFGAGPRMTERYAGAAEDFRKIAIRRNVVGRWFLMWVALFVTVGPTLIYLVGGHEVIAGRMTIGTIVAFVMFLNLLYGPTSKLANAHVEIMGAAALFRRIFEYLDRPRSIEDPAEPSRPAGLRGHLRFDKVSMRYGPGSTALEDVSFEAAPGQMVALVGPSGAGKTTISYLASRIYDPVAGTVSLDGVDLRRMRLSDLSQAIASVTQETTLFNASIEENLRFAKQDASVEELIRACTLAQVHDAIMALPHGYATVIGERGYSLSGGERQRLSLARALLRNSQVLILDEATSSLDSRSEALIQTALDAALAGRTSLVIAHRLSTILRANLILVLDGGVIVERGTHLELMKAGRLYAKLFATQFQQAQDVAPPDRRPSLPLAALT
jgi:ATP-binding cassette subfamily B protein